jgi:hypothetical protein
MLQLYKAFYNSLCLQSTYNKNTKGPTLMELFTAKEKLKKFF